MILGALAQLNKALDTYAAAEATYTRDQVVQALPIRAVPGARNDVEEGNEQSVVRTDLVTWTVLASELVVNGSPIAPKPGDIIAVQQGGSTVKYRAVDVAQGGAWVWSDASRTAYEISTVEVGTA